MNACVIRGDGVNRALAFHVARLLSGSEGAWSVVDEPTIHRSDMCVDLRRNDGAVIVLDARMYGARSGRLELRGMWPLCASGHRYTPRDSERKTITVDPGRGPLAVANEIARRLLPTYLPAYERARSWIALEEAATFQREHDAGCLARAFGARYHAGRSPADIYGDGVHARVTVTFAEDDGPPVTSVEFRTLHVTMDQAMAIARYLEGGELVAIVDGAGVASHTTGA